MNPEQLLNQVELAIKNRPPSKYKTCYLGFYKDKIACFPRKAQPPGFTPIIQVPVRNLEHGFSSAEWHDLSKRLWPYYERFILCPQHQKP